MSTIQTEFEHLEFVCISFPQGMFVAEVDAVCSNTSQRYLRKKASHLCSLHFDTLAIKLSFQREATIADMQGTYVRSARSPQLKGWPQ